jgi:hypothetical protein
VKRQTVVGGVIVLALAIGWAWWPDHSSKQVLPDGTTLILSGVQIGRTNGFSHGTMLSKVLGGLVPSNGVSVSRFKLQRARKVMMPVFDGESLAVELRLAPGSPRETSLLSPPFNRKYRLLISGEREDYAFVSEFQGFKKLEDGFFAPIWANSFPRDAKRLHFRLEEREKPDTREWRELARFVVKNPKRARIESWKPNPAPRFKLAEDLELEVGEVIVRREPIHPTDIWEYTASIPIRLTRHGQVVTNCGILEGKIRDASGNIEGVPGNKMITNGWIVHRMFRPADPTKLWRFKLHIGVDSNFAATNLFAFTVPFPMPRPLETNLGGFPCRIQFANTTMLNVHLTNQPPGVRLSFVSAVDENAHDLDDRSGSWGQHIFWRSLKVGRWFPGPTPKRAKVTVAIRPDYEAEFTLRPRNEVGRKE